MTEIKVGLSRRTALSAGAGLAALGLSTAAGCSTGTSGNETASNAQVPLPAYVPFDRINPDLPGTDQGVLPAFFAYPAEPIKATTEKPGKGGSLSGIAPIYGAVAPPVDRNRFWQQLNDRLGTQLELQSVTRDGLDAKLATLLASQDIPDLVSIPLSPPLPRMPDVLRHAFQDLTEYLSGDAVREYPFLAGVPATSWRHMIWNGGIYGIPLPRSPLGSMLFIREDFVARTSLNSSPANFAEFRELARALTDPRSNRWALGTSDDIMTVMNAMLGKPNLWSEDAGAFTYQYETDEMRRALSSGKQLVDDGVLHPDGFAATSTQAKRWLRSGNVAMFRGGYKGWILDIFADWPELENAVGGVVTPGFEGGKGSHQYSNTTFALVAVKKSNESRIREILRVCNWLAAPFGTEEYLIRKYGVRDLDYTLKGTDPTLTQVGVTETSLPVLYLADSPDVTYSPGIPGITRKSHDYQTREVPLIVQDPTVGLYSDTYSRSGAALKKTMDSLVRDVLQGRQSLAAWDEGVTTWRKNGGDTIRSEFQSAFEERAGK